VSITAPRGFVASGVAAGIKPSGALDLVLVATEDGVPVPTAATFTANLAAAAPVLVSREHLAATGGRSAAVLVSSGNANAATGAAGRDDAERMCRLVADGLDVEGRDVLVCSTGLIGFRLPMEAIERGVPALLESRADSPEAASAAATGMLTTDTGTKEVLVESPAFAVAGMAKGAAMLAPNMATMLAVLTTDAAVEPDALAAVLRIAVRDSFNAMTVDGCTSTNDTVVLMASGRAGRVDARTVEDAVGDACSELARQMAADAEGGSKVVRVRVTGARSDDEALRAARKVAESPLVKCSFNGEDPYWGRVASELGSAGVDFEMDLVEIAYGGVSVCRGGVAVGHDAAAVARHLAGSSIDLHCHLGLADGTGTVTGVDLGHGYVDENRTTS
jgi:glutamate N-acetyltransferase / amino-acid N-acetyltransferase